MAERTGPGFEEQRRAAMAETQAVIAALRTELMTCRDVFAQASFWLVPESGEGLEAQNAVRLQIRRIERLLRVPEPDCVALLVEPVEPV